MSHFWLVVAHAAALTLDGYSTHRFVQRGYVEANPIVRPLIGQRPTDARMAVFGAVELGATTWLVKKHPKAKWLQISLTAAHAGAGASNFRLK